MIFKKKLELKANTLLQSKRDLTYWIIGYYGLAWDSPCDKDLTNSTKYYALFPTPINEGFELVGYYQIEKTEILKEFKIVNIKFKKFKNYLLKIIKKFIKLIKDLL
tara:strand:+ start:475 stop:792 length:318 start_codon:yes stop_codon:yes gene_type:complete